MLWNIMFTLSFLKKIWAVHAHKVRQLTLLNYCSLECSGWLLEHCYGVCHMRHTVLQHWYVFSFYEFKFLQTKAGPESVDTLDEILDCPLPKLSPVLLMAKTNTYGNCAAMHNWHIMLITSCLLSINFFMLMATLLSYVICVVYHHVI